MRVAREKSAPWPPTFGLDGRTRPVLAGAGAIHGDLPARYRAAEDRPHSSGCPQRLGSTLSVPKRYPQLARAVVNLKVEDYFQTWKRSLIRFKEKGGKEKEIPVHHKLEEILDEYLKATGLEKEPGSPLFPASIGKTGKLSRRPLVRTDAADMLKRRLKQAGLPAHYSPHSFRATGITNFLENDGTLEAAQRIAGHADSRTTKLYDRRGQKVLLEDMERIRY